MSDRLTERHVKVFRVDAQGDTLYINAPTLKEAQAVLCRHMGDIPQNMLRWSGQVRLPDGEEALS